MEPEEESEMVDEEYQERATKEGFVLISDTEAKCRKCDVVTLLCWPAPDPPRPPSHSPPQAPFRFTPHGFFIRE